MNKTLTVAGLSLGLLIAGCSTEPSNESEAEPVAKKNERHVWSDQTDTIERAKQVEATVLKAAEQQRQALEAMED